ncbi:hypothetical protein [Roseivirga sp. UBA838]|uniref:hypothetical protein n=1 Tax=Roseivirga sp. UBA838 TaxID=1947393 RepID=UPI00257FCD38|nr:hypothetical protein [Roseivirga sp. UBA838]|tara:strand:+ start:19469 stop:19714 length:246 start_codon:yes stop_codon:yes gene_type:complete
MINLIAIAQDKMVQGIALMLTGVFNAWWTEKIPETNAFEYWQELGKTVAIWLPIAFAMVRIWHYFRDREKKRLKEQTDATK